MLNCCVRFTKSKKVQVQFLADCMGQASMITPLDHKILASRTIGLPPNDFLQFSICDHKPIQGIFNSKNFYVNFYGISVDE